MKLKMMKIVPTLFYSAVLLLCGCTTPMNTFTDRDAAANFSGYRTFSWIDEHPMIVSNQSVVLANPLMEARIQNAVRQELIGRGYEFVPVGDEADFVVSFTVGARQEIDVESYPAAYRSGWVSAYAGDSVEVRSTTEGTLAIDLFDVETRSPVWHGRIERSLKKKDRERRDELLREAIAAILNGFPSSAPTNNG